MSTSVSVERFSEQKLVSFILITSCCGATVKVNFFFFFG